MQTDFITFGEAISQVGFKRATQMLRRALGIKKPLAPWPEKRTKHKPLAAMSSLPALLPDETPLEEKNDDEDVTRVDRQCP